MSKPVASLPTYEDDDSDEDEDNDGLVERRVSLGQPMPSQSLLPSSSDDELFATLGMTRKKAAVNKEGNDSNAKKNEFYCKEFFNSTMGGRDVRVLFAMSIGMEGEFPQHDKPPFSTSKNCHKEVKPDLGTLQHEVVRWHNAYGIPDRNKAPRPKNWNKAKCIEFLESNDITLPSEIKFVKTELVKWKDIQVSVNQSQVAEEERIVQKAWSNEIPCLRMCHVLVDDDIRGEFARSFAVKTREELDGRNSGLFSNFYENAAKKFNNADWVPQSLCLPELHDDFAQSKDLGLTVTPVTPEQFQKKLTDARCKMVKVIADWEKSGSGRGMLVGGEGGDDENEALVHEFIDGDDRKAFLRERPPHVLCLWHIARTYGILQTVRQQLVFDTTVDGNNAPSVAGSSRKRKQDNDGFGHDVRRMTSSIDGLVSVARQSIEVHSLDVLFRRRRELEEAIQSLEDNCVEMELKILEETGHREAILKKALEKKTTECERKKEELQKIGELIEHHQTITHSA